MVACSTAPQGSPAPSSGTVVPSATPDPTADWPTFTSASGQLSFRYAPAWKPVECPAIDSPLIVLGHNACGQIEPSFSVDSVPATQAPAPRDERCDPSQPAIVSTNTTVDGVTGARAYVDYTGAAYNDCRHPVEHALVYSFFTDGRAYTITYLYIPSEGADQTSEVDAMVQTLRFSA